MDLSTVPQTFTTVEIRNNMPVLYIPLADGTTIPIEYLQPDQMDELEYLEPKATVALIVAMLWRVYYIKPNLPTDMQWITVWDFCRF
jgi:hypothetical protein